jgi:hypothetical protein
VNEVDKFTKQKRLETADVTLKAKLMEGLAARIRTVDSTVFVIISGYGSGAAVIGEADKAIFLLDDETTVTGYSTGIQSYDIGSRNTYSHQYRIYRADLETLAKHDVKSIRKYTVKGYYDLDIPEKNRGEIKGIASLIVKNLLGTD